MTDSKNKTAKNLIIAYLLSTVFLFKEMLYTSAKPCLIGLET